MGSEREMVHEGFELFAAQSFSKNFGLILPPASTVSNLMMCMY